MTYRQCIICEKPSLAREVASSLGKLNGSTPTKDDGFIKVGQDVVTWFAGHMYQQAMPSAYGDRWADFGNLASLPVVIPESEWILTVREGKEKQVRTVRDLARQSEIIVNCGDAGREGQLLIDEALQEWKLDPFAPNVMRIWSQDLTEVGMKAALQSMGPNSARQNLSMAALARSRADYQHGMTYSQLYTVLARQAGAKVTISVGRVQTPTLKLVVMRDRERASFKPVSHFMPKITFVHANGSFQASWIIPDGQDGLDTEGRLVDKAQAERICALVSGKMGEVASYTSDLKNQMQPLPFSQAGLVSECGRRLALTAAETLAVAQSLYDKKATSYPRTDSSHLPTNLRADCPPIVAELGRIDELQSIVAQTDMTIRSPAWNDSKITDHYGIVPTQEFSASRLSDLTDVERAVFMLIARQFVAQFLPAFQYRALKVEVACEGNRFRATGRQIVSQGWKVAMSTKEASDPDDRDENEEDEGPVLPEMMRGDRVQANGHEVSSMKTTPPPAYNDVRLAGEGGAMERAHLFETDPNIRKRLKEGDGIGRPATRAGIIETLLKRGFLKRKGKIGLESTELGRSVIDALPDTLCSVGLTAIWEAALDRIEKGEITLGQFLEAQANDLRGKVKSILENPAITIKGVKGGPTPLPGHGQPCPKCGKGVMTTVEWKSKQPPHAMKKALFCSIRECGHAIWDAHIKPLPGDGKPCTKCGNGVMKTKEITSKKDGKKYLCLSCTNYPDCRNSEFPDDGKGKGGKTSKKS